MHAHFYAHTVPVNCYVRIFSNYFHASSSHVCKSSIYLSTFTFYVYLRVNSVVRTCIRCDVYAHLPFSLGDGAARVVQVARWTPLEGLHTLTPGLALFPDKYEK